MGSNTRQPGLLSELLDFAFPPLCSGCGAYADTPQMVCGECSEKIGWFETQFFLDYSAGKQLKLFAGAEYRDPMKSIIVSFKFNGVTSLAPFLVSGFLEHQQKAVRELGNCTLVPIPLHPSREYQRGYNQAAILALELGERLELAVNEDILERKLVRRPQSRLRSNRRARNIRGVFSVDVDEITQLQGRSVILVDDVVTSGATIGEAASRLDENGVTVAAAIAMAHGL